MAWYRTGTIDAATGSKTVTGTNTKWANNKRGIGAGQMLLVPGSGNVQIYEIASVTSDTELTLTEEVTGDISGSAYAILAFYGNSYPDFARQLAAQLEYYQSQMDGWQEIMTGTGDVTLVSPNGIEVTISSMSELTSSVKGKLDSTGGEITGAINLSGNSGSTWEEQGFHLLWNEDNATGAACEVVNPGSGTGGKRLKLINNTNTEVLAQFEWKPDGAFYSPNGSYSVDGRVRAFSAVGDTYVEVVIDGGAKGVSFFDSDRTLKKDVEDADEDRALEIIRNIRPVSYKFRDATYKYQSRDPITGEMRLAEGKKAGSAHKYGVIAQEFEELLPEGIITKSDGKKALDPLEQIGLLLTVCHAQQKIIDSQNSRLDELEARLKAVDGLDA